MSFQLTANQMAALFGPKWQTLTRGAITDADPNSIVGQAISAQGAIGAWRTAYLTLFQYASDTETDPNTKTMSTSANPDVDPSTWLWLQGAADANAGIGYFSGVIRDYTAAQYKARTGNTLDPSDIYKASAEVAQNVFSELLPQNPRADASSFGIVPDIFAIASNDAGAIARSIFGGDYTPWSGALLFPYLGVGGIFEKLVLKAQQNKFPGEGDISQVVTSQKNASDKDTYDLVSILQAFPPLAPHLLDALSTALTLPQTEAENRLRLGGTIQLLKTLGTDTDTYLNGFYSLGSNDAFNIGSRLFPADPLNQASFFLGGLGIHAVVGTLTGNTQITVNNTDRNLVNAGPGDDTVVVNNTQLPLNPENPVPAGSPGSSVLDGGAGKNTLRYNVDKSISYTATYEPLTPDPANPANKEAPTSRVRVVGHSTQAPDTTDLAYRFQNLKLGAGDDTFSVGSETDENDFLDRSGAPTLVSLDGGDGIDTLDLSNLALSKPKMLMVDGKQVSFGGVGITDDTLDATGTQLANFEVLKGTDKGDYVVGSTEFKNINLGNGNNYVKDVSGPVLPKDAGNEASGHWVEIDLGGGSSTVDGTLAPGSEIYAGAGHTNDHIQINPDTRLHGLNPTDVLSWGGRVLTGGIHNTESDDPWAYDFGHFVRYGINAVGDLAIQTIQKFGDAPEDST